MNLDINQQSIISILGIQSLSDERKADILDQASALVEKRLLVRVMESLDDAKRQEFESMLENSNREALQAFMTSNVPRFTDWVGEEVNNLKKEFADLASNIE